MVLEVLDDPELLQIRTIQFILDLLDLTFAELFYGFSIISRIIVCFLKGHFETWTPVNFIRFTKWTLNTSMVILITPWTFLHLFLNEGGNIWTIGETGQLVKFVEYSRYLHQGTQAKVPKPH